MKLNSGAILALTCAITLSGCGPTMQNPASTSQQPTASAPSAGTQEVYEGSINGVISDSMCGKDHSKMGPMGTDAGACTQKCVMAGASYVLVDRKGDVYNLSDQDKPKKFAGKPVTITGHIDPATKSIHLHSIAAAS